LADIPTRDLSPEKPNTFLVRSLNGMAINAASSPTGVNVNIGGAVQIDGRGLDLTVCNPDTAGTFEMENGCFYFCDGSYWQSLNAAFNEGNQNGQQCEYMSRCEFNGIKVRPGEQVWAYKYERDPNTTTTQGCETLDVNKKKITCGTDGKFNDQGYTYSYCMPYDGTPLDIINQYHP
jgi:hypothetical protein